MAGSNILLVEPGYRNKYPPLGLMKIAQYHGPNYLDDNVTFVKFFQAEKYREISQQVWDRIYVTTLFTFEWDRINKTIDFAIDMAMGDTTKVFVGGIAISLMPESFYEVDRWNGVRFIEGLLDKSPAESLRLDPLTDYSYEEESSVGESIEFMVPDYSILEQIEYIYPANNAYFLYATRGCPRDCSFCGVPKLEGRKIVHSPSILDSVEKIKIENGQKVNLLLMDNNVVATSDYKFKELIQEIIDAGFGKGAQCEVNGRLVKRSVDFNQGVDARILSQKPWMLEELAKICIDPLRIAFDNLSFEEDYRRVVTEASNHGLVKLSNYLLYNYEDDPADLYKRMRINIELNEALDIRIFSFPMRYQPINIKDRSYVGALWNRYYLRSLQIILQATHGIVSGAPAFFKEAFGDSVDDFYKLIQMPHHYIFNRFYYKELAGKKALLDYQDKFESLTEEQRDMLINILSEQYVFSDMSWYQEREKSIKDKAVRNIFKHYFPLKKSDEREIWKNAEAHRKAQKEVGSIPEHQVVADVEFDEVAIA